MPFYSDEVLEDIKEQNNIVDVLSDYIKLKKQGSGYVGLCPFHNEKTPSFHVNEDQQFYHCFGCKEGGSVYTFLMRYENLTFPEAVAQLADRCGYKLPKLTAFAGDKKGSERKQRLLDAHKDAAAFYFHALRAPESKEAYAYFTNRGLGKEMMQAFGLGFTGRRSDGLYQYLKEKGYSDKELIDAGLILFDEKRGARDRFWNRVIFPIMDEQKKVIAFGGRVMGSGEPKYLHSQTSEIFDKSRTLYGMHLARRTRRPQFILCEGYMDVIALHQAGFDNAIATLGTALTEGHAHLLKRKKKPIYLCYDNDTAGQQAIIRGFRILQKEGIEARVITLEPYKDPDAFLNALSPEDFEERVSRAKNAFLYVMGLIRNEYDVDDPAGLTQFENRMAGELLVFEEENERNNYIKFCAQEFMISFDALSKMVNRLGVAKSGGVERRMVPKKTRVNGIRTTGEEQAEKIFLHWMMQEEFFAALKDVVLPEEFTEGILRQAAELIYDKMNRKEPIDQTQILNQFEEATDQSKLSEIFFGMEGLFKEASEEESAMREITLRIKEHSSKRARMMMDASDAAGLQREWDKQREDQKRISEIQFDKLIKKE